MNIAQMSAFLNRKRKCILYHPHIANTLNAYPFHTHTQTHTHAMAPTASNSMPNVEL